MKPIVLAVTGASALPLAERALQLLLINELNVYLVLSKGAYKVFNSERKLRVPLDIKVQEKFWRDYLKTEEGLIKCFKWDDMSASIASGSFLTSGMVIMPCSMGKVGRISSGASTDLIERAADVHLKEKRKLVICPRESPFNLIHLKNLTLLAESGASIIPPIPAWYSGPKTIDELIDFMVVRTFDIFELDLQTINRWR